VSPRGLIAELDALAKIGVDTSRISISDRAHIVFPFHAILDQAAERARAGRRSERRVAESGRPTPIGSDAPA